VHRIIVTTILVAALLPLVAACQKSYEELPPGELVEAEPCDCEEPCPDCICEEPGEAPAPATAAENDAEGGNPGGR
jgi:hypothetical protein